MSAKKKTVTTPLHLLQQLSGSLLEHLESACSQALTDAEKLLGKLEKQRVKAQDKLHQTRENVRDAALAGKKKAQTKAKVRVAELEGLLDDLKATQTQTRSYIVQLKRDAQESLKLAQGVGKVREAAAKVLVARDAKSAEAKVPAKKPVAVVKKTPVKAVPSAAVKAVEKPAVKTSAKAPATRAAVKPAVKPAAKAPLATARKTPAKAASPAKPVAAKTPAKPAAKPAAKAPAARRAPASAAKPATAPAKPATAAAKPVARRPRTAAAKPAAPANKPSV